MGTCTIKDTNHKCKSRWIFTNWTHPCDQHCKSPRAHFQSRQPWLLTPETSFAPFWSLCKLTHAVWILQCLILFTRCEACAVATGDSFLFICCMTMLWRAFCDSSILVLTKLSAAMNLFIPEFLVHFWRAVGCVPLSWCCRATFQGFPFAAASPSSSTWSL